MEVAHLGQSANENQQEAPKPDSSFENVVKLRKLAPGIYGLNRNGLDMACPRNFGQPCYSACPLFGLEERNSVYYVEVGCSNHISYKINELIPFVPQPSKPTENV